VVLSIDLFSHLLFYHRKDHAKAVDILVKELKVFSTFNEELFKEITMLLTLTNFRYILYFLSTFFLWFH